MDRSRPVDTLEVPESERFLEAAQSLARFVVSTTQLDRTDCLWPADAVVFQTNPLHIAHGACGIALFAQRALGELPEGVEQWLLDRSADTGLYPPGLYSGLAGVAWSFSELGLRDRGLELIRAVDQHPLAYQSCDIHNGAAGWGLAALALYLETAEEGLLELAERAGKHILEAAIEDENGLYWQGVGDEAVVRLGFAYGPCGIALFLLYLWQLTGESAYLDTARRAMEFESRQAKPDGDSLVWGTTLTDEGHRPYWLRGGAGFATTAARFFHTLGDPAYLDLTEKATKGCAVFFSAAPHLFEGLTSMGESLLDYFWLTGDSHYLEKARQKAEQALLFRVETEAGWAMPGRYSLRISNDYGVGGAGIGLFLLRLARGERGRLLHDIQASPGRFPKPLGLGFCS
ncbi:MAG: lanthionine synthetase C family protein [Acidobacteriota bacterium]